MCFVRFDTLFCRLCRCEELLRGLRVRMEMEAINQIFISTEVTDRRVSTSTVSLAQTETLQKNEAV